MGKQTKKLAGQLDCFEDAPRVAVEDTKQWTVVRDDCADLRFTGKLLAVANSRECAGPCSIRWETLELYRTRAGAWVCSRVELSLYAEEGDHHTGAVCASQDDVVAFLGHGDLANEVYAVAGIECAERIA